MPGPDTRQQMLDINQRQKDFYEKVRTANFEQAAESKASSVWSHVRSRLWAFQDEIGMREAIAELHKSRLGDVSRLRVLDLGCGNGSELSLWFAEHAGEYVGIDLAEIPVKRLNDIFAERGFTSARAIAHDFLDNPFPDGHFDVVYAASVLHHFKDTEVLVDELLRVLKQGGLGISHHPMKTEPVNRAARAIYRRWQDDRDWEWPFSRESLRMLGERFEIDAVQGVLGMSRFAIPFFVIPGLGGVGRAVARWGVRFDNRRARSLSPALYNCWQVAMVLRKPA
jgi:ubiquinone/menaquinone biosynthesis C-methylase UbiE